MNTVILTAIAALGLNLSVANTQSLDQMPGWTGHKFVAGSHSSIAGDSVATRATQTGQYGG